MVNLILIILGPSAKLFEIYIEEKRKSFCLYWLLRILCSKMDKNFLLNAVICENKFVILTWFFEALGCWPCQLVSKWPSESDLLKAITCCNVDTAFPIYNWHVVKLVKCGFLKISVNKLSLSCTVMDHRYQIYHFDAGRTIKWSPAYNWFIVSDFLKLAPSVASSSKKLL